MTGFQNISLAPILIMEESVLSVISDKDNTNYNIWIEIGLISNAEPMVISWFKTIGKWHLSPSMGIVL